MLIHLSSWPEIDARLKSGAALSKTVIVPIGSNEQHGRRPRRNDACCTRPS